jgi:hypothetical protein
MLVPEIFWHYDGCNLDFPKLFMNKNHKRNNKVPENREYAENDKRGQKLVRKHEKTARN